MVRHKSLQYYIIFDWTRHMQNLYFAKLASFCYQTPLGMMMEIRWSNKYVRLCSSHKEIVAQIPKLKTLHSGTLRLADEHIALLRVELVHLNNSELQLQTPETRQK